MLYVYALVSEPPHELPGVGIASEALQVIPCGRLLAVAGEMDAAPHLDPELLRAHEATVRRVADLTDAILPARFGSVVPDVRTLAELLEPRAAQLHEALRLVQGCEQMTVRVYGQDADGGIHPEQIQPPSSGGPGTRYLTQKMQEQNGAWDSSQEASLQAHLAPLIKAQRVQRGPAGSALLASVYHLIERGQGAPYVSLLETYTDANAQLAHPSVHLVPSGPWPPYAFGSEWL